MKVTLWIADIMAEFIKSCEDKVDTGYEIDLWCGDNVVFERKDVWLYMRKDYNDGFIGEMRMWKAKVEEIKEVLLDRIWVYENEVE